MKNLQKRIISIMLAVLMAVSGIVPAMSAFGADGVEGYYNLEIFYADSNTIVPSYGDDGEDYKEYMREGDELQLTYKLIDSAWPDNGSIKWYSEAPALVDVTQDGLVKAFDSSKGAVIHAWIDNEVKPIPLVGSLMAKAIEKALFNEYVNIDTLDTEEIVDIVVAVLGSDSAISDYFEAYQGHLIDSLREYLDKINSDIHCELYDSTGAKVAEDEIHITVLKNEEWYANFLPNGTHITNKSQIATTQAKGNTVQLSAITTPQRLNFGVVYSVKSTSIFTEGKSVATVTDGGLVTFRNTGTVTILASPDSEQVIQKILEMVNYFYKLENTGTLNTDKIAEVLIKYMGIDINRAVLAGILDAAFAIYKIAGDAADPVQLTATAVEILANIILQMRYNDSITFTVVEATPITDFKLGGNLTIKEGTMSQLTIDDMQPSTGDKTDLVWESADPNIASVDENGIVTGLDAGGSLGALSSQQVEITCTSTTNDVRRTVTVTVTGKTGKYISGARINGSDLVEINTEEQYSYSVYPSRVAEADNLYVYWGMVTGEDEEGNPVYTWADDKSDASDGIGAIDSKGMYRTITGGKSTIALMVKTGYYLSNGDFFEISSKTVTKEIETGIPVEKINIKVTGGSGLGDKSIDSDKVVNINGVDYEYVTAQIGVMTAYSGKGAAFSADVYPNDATNQKLTWVYDGVNYEQAGLSDDTHSVMIRQKSAREKADYYNVYAVSADGRVKSNVITVCVTRNMATGNKIDADKVDMVNGENQDLAHTMTFTGTWTGEAYACYKCNWYSSDESVVSVSQKNNEGKRDAILHANDVGTATIYCVSADGAFVDSVEVTVRPDKTYLKEVIGLCEKTIVYQTAANKADYKKYMRKLDLAYTIYYEEEMASQDTCDTYAQELLYSFIRVGGYVGINNVKILGTGKSELPSDYVTVKVSSTKSYKNYSYDFDYSVFPANAMYSKVVWTSSNNSIAVNQNGVCTPTNNSACSAVITCTITDYNGTTVSSSKVVAFARTKATGVVLDKEYIREAKIGDQATIKATVQPTNALGNSTASVTDVTWRTSNPKVATVDDNGVVTFNYGGNAIIICTTQDGGHIATCNINVVTNYDALVLFVNQLTDLRLNKINYYPETWEVYQKALNEANTILARRVSSQEEVDAAYANLDAAYKGLKKYVYINTVELYLDGEATSEFYQYDLSPFKEGISYKNAKLNLKVRLYPNNASYQAVKWESSVDSISVNNVGECSPTTNKSCYGLITCTVLDHYGNQFSDTVWVSFSYRPVTGVDVSEKAINGKIGDTHQLSCVIYPVGDTLAHIGKADIQDYYWESDDESVATVDETGKVTFVGAGSTIVRCVSYDGGHNAECKVSTEGDRTALSAAIEKYKDIDYTKYEYDYAIRFKNSYEAAEKALTNNSLTQVQIDAITNNLVSAAEALESHPYVHVQSIGVSYETYKRSLSTSTTWNFVESGSIGYNDAVSINLANNYTSNNSNNKIVLKADFSPSNAMYKNVTWNVVASDNAETSANNTEFTIKPKENTGAYAIVDVDIVDHFGDKTTRRLYVVLADNTATGLILNSPSSITMYPTESAYKMDCTIDGSPRFTDIYYTSSDTAVATVDSNGYIKAVEKGKATITAKTLDGGYTKTMTVNVLTDFKPLAQEVNTCRGIINSITDDYQYTAESIETLQSKLTEAEALVLDGKATQAEVNAMYDELVAARNALVNYVAAEGVSIGVGPNQDTVVSVVNPGFIRYTGSVLTNRTVQLVPVVTPADGLYTKVTWESSNPAITIDEDGVVTNKAVVSSDVTSVGAGVTKITCTLENAFGQRYVAESYLSFVRYGATGITFDNAPTVNGKKLIYGAPGEVKPVDANLNQGNHAKSSMVNDCLYKSDNTNVATVDEDGNITFVSQGTTKIHVIALDGGYTGVIDVMTTWDTTSLQAAIKAAEPIDYKEYAYDYGMTFHNALENAKAVYADVNSSQATINNACTALLEAQTNLEGHPYIRPNVVLTSGNAIVENNKSCQVDNKNRVEIVYAPGEGAMYKSITVEAKGDNITATQTDTGVIIARKDYNDTAVELTVKIVDDYGDETTKTMTIRIVNQIVKIDSFDILVNGEVVDGSYAKVYGRLYSGFEPIKLTYSPNPANATAPKSVTWSSSASSYITVDTVDGVGVLDLTTLGKAKPTNTAKITCTITNDDDSVKTKTISVTLSRS